MKFSCFWSNFPVMPTLNRQQIIAQVVLSLPYGRLRWSSWFLSLTWFNPDCFVHLGGKRAGRSFLPASQINFFLKVVIKENTCCIASEETRDYLKIASLSIWVIHMKSGLAEELISRSNITSDDGDTSKEQEMWVWRAWLNSHSHCYMSGVIWR